MLGARGFAIVVVIILAGCRRPTVKPTSQLELSSSEALSPCALALAPHRGPSRIDDEIVRLQKEARAAVDRRKWLERLAWSFIAKARLSYDQGFYHLAEQCALCLESARPGDLEARLLRGHVLHSRHRFREAEALARGLVAVRGGPFDFGLLGDALFDQGRLSEAADAYQKMMDLKPCLESYSRAAQVRWLKGDVEGARQAMQLAVRAGSSQAGESTAWAYSRLAMYELAAGATDRAQAATTAALAQVPDYAPALLWRGRILLAAAQIEPAIAVLRQAAVADPLPEYQWVLAEALRAGGREAEARAVEEQLVRIGGRVDPRGLALFLATRRRDIPVALSLARQELESRGDVFTWDALAWALAASGDVSAARKTMARALAEGTQDARLFYHAAAIAREAGERQESRRWLAKASALKEMLLPCEQTMVIDELARL